MLGVSRCRWTVNREICTDWWVLTIAVRLISLFAIASSRTGRTLPLLVAVHDKKGREG